jgi:hypothetical protein
MRFALLLLCVLLLTSTAALAGSPADLANPVHTRAEASFLRFVERWMQKVHTLEQKHRDSPTVKGGATRPLITYRGYGDEYSIELRPTGNARAPYVGLLRYTEHVYSCESMEAETCRIASSVPVTEIFRFQNGRWSY